MRGTAALARSNRAEFSRCLADICSPV